MFLCARRSVSRWLGVLLVVAGAGCEPAVPAANPRLGGEPSPFPTRAEVAKIAAAPLPARLFDDRGKDVPTWDLTDTLPDAIESAPHPDGSAWGKLLADAAAARAGEVSTTEAMYCVAREHAAFFAVNEAMPAEALKHFIAARCGAQSTGLRVAVNTVGVDDRVPDEKVFALLLDPVKAVLGKILSEGRLDAGIAYVRRGGRAGIGIAVAKRSANLERVPFVPGPDGEVVVQGELLVPGQAVRALVNRGRYGFAACKPNPAVHLPRFSFTCTPSREDEVAWLTVNVVPPGHLLSTPLFNLLLWPAGKIGKTYAKLAQIRPAGDAAPPARPAPGDLLGMLNAIRKDAGLAPLRLEEAESRTATLVVPHFFGALTGNEKDTSADQVALGLLAGWDVAGMVRNGRLVSASVGSLDYGELMREVLATPTGREALLDPQAERLAIGAVGDEKEQTVGAIFSAYALFDSYRHDQDAGTVAARIAELRAARGAPAPVVVAELNVDADRAAKSVQLGLKTPEEALNAMMQQASQRLGGRGVRGLLVETTSLEQLKLPDAMLAQPALTLGVGVSHYRREGQPWGHFMVYVVVLADAPGATTTAGLGATHAG